MVKNNSEGEIRMESSYQDNICNVLNRISQNSYNNMVGLDSLPLDKAREILTILLGFACEAQNIANITIARGLILQIPSKWLLDNLKSVAEETIDFNDDWEYRRLLELVECISKELLKWAVELGLNSNDIEIKEVAEDFKEKL